MICATVTPTPVTGIVKAGGQPRHKEVRAPWPNPSRRRSYHQQQGQHHTLSGVKVSPSPFWEEASGAGCRRAIAGECE